MSLRQGAIRRLGALTAAAWALTAGAWLADALGRGLPAAADRTLAAAALALTAAWCVRGLRRLARPAAGEGGAARWLPAVLALALLLAFAGLGHELTGRSFGDEGIYLARAQAANQGNLLRPWFIYPHLLIYLDAAALWLAGLAGPLTGWLARTLYAAEGELAQAALVSRSVTALCGALTTLPVYCLGRRLAGATAGVLGALALALSPVWQEIAHLNLSDVTAGFFAALTLAAAARLLDGESLRGYLAAGAAAGLAAGAKYPGAVVAVAVAAVWLRWRLAGRSTGDDDAARPLAAAALLAAAAAATIAVFIATTPSLVAFPGAVYTGGGRDILFGVRQYAAGGWTGVVRSSNALYYLGVLSRAFGAPLLVAGVTGLALIGRRRLYRVGWMLVFPAVYLLLVGGLEMAVRRNLMPVLPALAAVLGVGLAGFLGRLRSPASGRLRSLAAAALVALCLAPPAWTLGEQTVRSSRPGTRDLARAWIEANLPPGSFIVREEYTPDLGRPFLIRKPRFAYRIDPDDLEDPRHDFLLLASGSYDRFLRPGNLTDDPVLAVGARRYREIFERYELVRRFPRQRLRSGPEILLYRLDPTPPVYHRQATLTTSEALTSHPAMRSGEDPETPVRVTGDGQWVLFKAHLEPGPYRVHASGDIAPGPVLLRVLDRGNREHAALPLRRRPDRPATAEIRLPARDKYFLYLDAPPGSRIDGLTVEPAAGAAAPTPIG